MRGFLYWLLGDQTGRWVVGTCHWACISPISTLGQWPLAKVQLDLAIAEESLRSLQERVQELKRVVATQEKHYQAIEQLYQAKQSELVDCERTLERTEETTKIAALAIRQLQLQQLVPQLEQQLQQAEQFVQLAQRKLRQQQTQLQEYEAKLQNRKDLATAKQYLTGMARASRALRMESSQT